MCVMRFQLLLATCVSLVTAEASFSIGDVGGAPCLFRDGKVVAPMLFWQWRFEKNDVTAMSGAGITSFTCFGSTQHYKNPYWRADGTVSVDWQTTSLDELSAWAPDAVFLPRLFATAPDWWIGQHPEEAIAWANPHPGDGVKPIVVLRESFASKATREAVSPHFGDAVRRLFARYGDKLMGIHVANGPCGENFAWDTLTCTGWPSPKPECNGYSDISVAMTVAFRRYLREKYGTVAALQRAWRDGRVDFDNATVPDQAERHHLNADGWRDPAEGRRVPDYFECHNWVTVDMLEHYARIVKKASNGRLLTFVFYGYTQDEVWTIECDHRAISKAYRSKVLDCFSAPHTYHRRRPGEDGAMRCYFSSAALHGKLFFDEGDDMTYLERLKKRPDPRAYSADVDESLAVLYREFGMTLTHGVGLWFMDLTGGNFRDPRLVEAVGRCRRWSEESLAMPRTHQAEVAVISQPESEFYMGYRLTSANPVSTALYREEMAAYYRSGAPFDWYLAEDLDAVRARRYKVVALLDCEYLTNNQYDTLLKMKADGVKFVFYHAPGYVSQDNLDWSRVKTLTGGAEYRTLARYSPGKLREMFRRAGVHVYTESDNVVLSANAAHVMLHSRANGDYAVRLPARKCITELVSGKLVSGNTDTFIWPLEANRTAIFRVTAPQAIRYNSAGDRSQWKGDKFARDCPHDDVLMQD